MVLASTKVVFDASVYQPTKVYPVLLGTGNSPYTSPYETLILLFIAPQLELNDTVYFDGIQFTSKTTSQFPLLVSQKSLAPYVLLCEYTFPYSHPLLQIHSLLAATAYPLLVILINSLLL